MHRKADHAIFQSDLDALEVWGGHWGMNKRESNVTLIHLLDLAASSWRIGVQDI